MMSTLPRTGQAGGLAHFIEQNQQEIIGAITDALGLGGPWALLVGWILGWALNECLDPWEKNRQFRQELDQANRKALAGRVSSVQSRPMPEIEEGTLQALTVIAETDSPQRIGYGYLVLPWDQTVTVRYAVSGHAASPCHQDVAIVQIVGVDGKTVRVFWRQEAEGIARVFNPETVTRSGEESVSLRAGAYVVQATVSGDHSTARIEVTYETAQIRQAISPLVWLAAAGLVLAMRRRRA